MIMSLEFFAIAAPAVMFSGMSKGGFGSGAAFASAAILAIVLDPGQAIGIMLPLLMLMDVTSLKPYWKKWMPRESLLLILGAMPGVALGAWLYASTDADLFRLLIGSISLLFVAWQISLKTGLIRAAKTAMPDWAGLVAGAVSGFTSFVSHAGGPPSAVYLLSKHLNKTDYQATTVIVFWAINIAKAIPYAFLGLFTLETLKVDLLLAPFAVIGVWIGVKAHQMIPDEAFFGLTYVLLTITGTRLIWDALT